MFTFLCHVPNFATEETVDFTMSMVSSWLWGGWFWRTWSAVSGLVRPFNVQSLPIYLSIVHCLLGILCLTDYFEIHKRKFAFNINCVFSKLIKDIMKIPRWCSVGDIPDKKAHFIIILKGINMHFNNFPTPDYFNSTNVTKRLLNIESEKAQRWTIP